MEWMGLVPSSRKLFRCLPSFPKNFFARPFLCGFSTVENLQKLKTHNLGDRSPIIKADSSEHYRRYENVRIFGIEDEPCEDVFTKVVNVAESRELQSLQLMLVPVTVYRMDVKAQNI